MSKQEQRKKKTSRVSFPWLSFFFFKSSQARNATSFLFVPLGPPYIHIT